jgi:hypothetical protein
MWTFTLGRRCGSGMNETRREAWFDMMHNSSGHDDDDGDDNLNDNGYMNLLFCFGDSIP